MGNRAGETDGKGEAREQGSTTTPSPSLHTRIALKIWPLSFFSGVGSLLFLVCFWIPAGPSLSQKLGGVVALLGLLLLPFPITALRFLRRSKQRKEERLVSVATVLTLLIIPWSILAPTVIRARSCSQISACKSNLENIGTALEIFSVDHQGRYPSSLQQLVENRLLREIPSCPSAGSDTYSGSYQVSEDLKSYLFCCKGHFHSPERCPHHPHPPDYPRYDSKDGLIDYPPGRAPS